MSWLAPRPFRPSYDQQTPVDRQKPPRQLFRRGSTSNHEKRPFVRKSSRDNGFGQWKDPDDGGRRSRNRSNSSPPDNRTHYHPPQDGRTQLLHASANASWQYAENWADTSWFPGRSQTVHLQMSSHSRMDMVLHGGQPEDDRRGRGRRSSDAKRPNPVQSPRTPRPAYSAPSSPVEIPVIPRFTSTGGMGFRNLLRKHSRDRPKIFFYHKYQPYYGFTNFSPHSVEYGGKVYPTSEHLFQALKVSRGGVSLLGWILLNPGSFRLFSSLINPT